jgi:transposase
MRKAYSTDVSDAEWSYLKAYLPTPKPHGRPRVHGTREVLNAIFYIVRGGCPWRLLPHDLIKPLLGRIGGRFPRLSHLWLDAGYNGQGKGADWVQKALGWTAEIVRRPPKVAPQEVMKAWIREWAKEWVTIDWQKLLPMEDSRALLPRRWVIERTFSWLAQNRRLSKDYERLTETSEAFVYVAMTRPMVRRLACA